MRETGHTGHMDGARSNNGKHSIEMFPEQMPRPTEMANFAAEVRKLTNYEVLRMVESALGTLTPWQGLEGSEWSSVRILLDELKWRMSGLEGPGAAANRTPMDIRPN